MLTQPWNAVEAIEDVSGNPTMHCAVSSKFESKATGSFLEKHVEFKKMLLKCNEKSHQHPTYCQDN